MTFGLGDYNRYYFMEREKRKFLSYFAVIRFKARSVSLSSVNPAVVLHTAVTSPTWSVNEVGLYHAFIAFPP